MISRFLCALAMSHVFNPDPDPPAPSFDHRVMDAALAQFREGEQPATLEFLFHKEDVAKAQVFVYGAIRDVEWLTAQETIARDVCAALRGSALNGHVWVYRIRVEAVESEGKRFSQVIVIYDV